MDSSVQHVHWAGFGNLVVVLGIFLTLGQLNILHKGHHSHVFCQGEVINFEEARRLDRLVKAVYNDKWREFPEYATVSGYHDYDDSLESYTVEAFERRKDMAEGWLREAKEIEVAELSRKDQREIRILRSYIQTYLDGYQWKDYGALTAVNFLEGAAKRPQWALEDNSTDEATLQRFLKRLAAVPAQVDEQITLMKRAIRLKRTSHSVSVDRVPAMMDLVNVENMYFSSPLEDVLKKSKLPVEKRTHILDKARTLLYQAEQAWKKLRTFVQQEYLPATRSVEGVHSLSHGLKYYQACLDWYLGVRMTPEQVFELGVREVARIEKNIKKIMESVGFTGDLKSFFQYVKYIPKFYNHTKEDLLLRYEELLKIIIEPKLERLFYNVDIPPVTLVPMENDGPWGSYGKNMFVVNLKEPKKRSTFTMLPLALHETNPGHHFQESYTRRFNIPGYRSDSMSGRLYSVPFHYPVYSAYAEGWALYAEYLGEEMGLFHDNFDLFGRYCSEIFRACRLVVDTGIHAFGWSRDRAITFLANYSDFPASQIAAEVDRYITWPGQACAYKVGEIKIKELRQRAQEELGRRFDVKEFHHEVLKVGNVPLDILEEVVLEWVQLKKQRQRNAQSHREAEVLRDAPYMVEEPRSGASFALFRPLGLLPVLCLAMCVRTSLVR